ncbi:hypothetical protein ACFQMA_09275 [Halosimplex aquaticum]|uniref:Uncharacterized protein n=1 Tax=Halosimplex aquaticum TaxID=3026162 RepID=A0ABD5Y2D7_9EURY|nr:hypothetical protein [Halosimplex aquaticum]
MSLGVLDVVVTLQAANLVISVVNARQVGEDSTARKKAEKARETAGDAHERLDQHIRQKHAERRAD